MSKETYIRLSGGLGNQLHQYAFKRNLELSTGTECKLDTAWYDVSLGNSKRSLILKDLFPATNQYVNTNGIFIRTLSKVYIGTKLSTYLYKRFQDRKIFSKFAQKTVVGESQVKELSEFLGGYCVGSFTSLEYWRINRKTILDEVSDAVRRYGLNSHVRSDQTLVIHARQGDYVEDPKTKSFHGYCGIEYFQEEAQSLLENNQVKNIMIYSDSAEFATELVKHLKRKTNIKLSVVKEDHPVKILNSMASADYFIGSNSTLSWWANALGNHKISIFPGQWFSDMNNVEYDDSFFAKKVTISTSMLTTD